MARKSTRCSSDGCRPTILWPYNYIDLRARLLQTVVDLTAWKNYKSANESFHADQLSAQDSRDLVVLAVGGAYLLVIADKARVQSALAQLDTANALYQQAAQQRAVGVVAQVDVDRSQVQALTQQQRVTSLQNDLAKQKINLARMTGLPPTTSTTSPMMSLSRLRRRLPWRRHSARRSSNVRI